MLNEYMDDSMLLATLERQSTPTETKEASICAFVLARKAQKQREDHLARHFAEKCLELLSKRPLETLEECTHPYIAVDGVLIPGLFHEGTVRRDLADVLR